MKTSALRTWLRQERAMDYKRWLSGTNDRRRPPGEPVWRTVATLWFQPPENYNPYAWVLSDWPDWPDDVEFSKP